VSNHLLSKTILSLFYFNGPSELVFDLAALNACDGIVNKRGCFSDFTVIYFVTSSGGSLFQITLAVLVSGLLIPYKDKLVNFADRKLPAAKFKQLDVMLGQYALQRLVSGFALGVVLFIGNIIILRNGGLALGIASLAFVLDFIPYVGPFFAFIINAIVVLVVSPKWLSLLLS